MDRISSNQMPFSGSVGANAPIDRNCRLAGENTSLTQAFQPIPLLQLVTRGDPPGCDDVRQISTVIERGIGRQSFKKRRSAALAEWQPLAS
jgi:hypothetical protein